MPAQHRCRRQPRRPAQAGQAPAAEDRLRLHRGRPRGRGRARPQRGRLQRNTGWCRATASTSPRATSAPPCSAGPTRARSASRPTGRRRPVPARRRHDAGRGGQGRQRALHHVGRRHRLDRGPGQARARPRLVPALRRPRPQDLRGHDAPRRATPACPRSSSPSTCPSAPTASATCATASCGR